tara:strand:- start:368 stop:646 length:279 start_codon:yes stop_codon:yes gene_type:complete
MAIKLKDIISEADVFDTGGSEKTTDTSNEPKGNMGVKRFNALVASKRNWETVTKQVQNLNDIKQTEFILFLLDNLGISETAKAKIKLKLGGS